MSDNRTENVSLADLGRAVAARWGEPTSECLGYVNGAPSAFGPVAAASLVRYVVPPARCDGCGAFVPQEDATEADDLVLCLGCDRMAAMDRLLGAERLA
jgi:hypothetical protein